MERILEQIDLRTAFGLLSMIAVLLALYVMNLTSSTHEDGLDPPIVRWTYRVGLFVIISSLLWAINFSEARSWQPWPPVVGLLIGLILMLTCRAVAIRMRIAREGPRLSKARGPTFHVKHTPP